LQPLGKVGCRNKVLPRIFGGAPFCLHWSLHSLCLLAQLVRLFFKVFSFLPQSGGVRIDLIQLSRSFRIHVALRSIAINLVTD
jgi:hypothetical protein